MSADSAPIALGMDVVTRDGTVLGAVSRIWYPDGRVEPPDPDSLGTLQIVTAERPVPPQTGFFQIDRSLAPDWFATFDDVTGVSDSGIQLKVTIEEADRKGFQQKPVVRS